MSVLFARPEQAVGIDALDEPDFFADLNLDQVLESLTERREGYRLEPFFYAALHDVASVRYRQEVLRDLEKPDVRAAVERFAQAMRRMRARLEQREVLHYRLQRESMFLGAVATYCAAVRTLADDLDDPDVTSTGLRRLRDRLGDYMASDRFVSLAEETAALTHDLGEIHYTVRTEGLRVTVDSYAGEADYSIEIEHTFARFRQGAVQGYLVSLPERAEMNHVEARILDLVAELHPEPFAQRRSFCTRRRDFLDGTLARFDREVQLYLAYLELVERLRAAGLPFCYPQVSTRTKAVAVTDTFDIALAAKLVPEGGPVVCNDLRLEREERVFVVSGPNNGGKTTFARTFGQLHHLAALGLPVPGREARLFLPDRIFTHFEREEDIQTLRGKFDDELVRVHEILEQATPASVIVMNESFNSTTLSDALFVGTEVMRQVLDLGCLAVYVTFVDEISSLSPATVSMVSQIEPANPAQRTFKVLRQPADGRAYAWAIADKYGLTPDRLMERIGA